MTDRRDHTLLSLLFGALLVLVAAPHALEAGGAPASP